MQGGEGGGEGGPGEGAQAGEGEDGEGMAEGEEYDEGSKRPRFRAQCSPDARRVLSPWPCLDKVWAGR